jgi:transketolase
MSADLAELSIDTIRTLAMDAVQQANSGHPGMPMGCAPMAYLLFREVMAHDPAAPDWPDRDRFVLSAGHGSMLLYSALHLTGYERPTLDDIKAFRQWGSVTPGHPESHELAGVETTTGPLGQGFANGVGMALAVERLAAEFNRPGHDIVDHRIYGIVSDGDLMEGVSAEAASLAGTLRLGRITYLYDDNRITIDGSTDLAFTEDVVARFDAYGWHTQRVDDGNDLEALRAAIAAAELDPRPSLISVRTTIGYGSPNKAGTSASHGAPLGEDEVALTKQALGWPHTEPFTVPDEVRDHLDVRSRGAELREAWETRLAAYRDEHPELAAEFDRRVVHRQLPEGWEEALPELDGDDATRKHSGAVINELAPVLPELIGGSADLAASNNTDISGAGDFTADDRGGRNLRFGVREHAMASMANGMALHGGLLPYVASFLVFTDYCRPAIRLAALMGQRVVYVMTHDSIGLGEDGPTHQPVEHLASLRAIPGLTVIRPADGAETVAAWRAAVTAEGPTVIALTRQGVPALDVASARGSGPSSGGDVETAGRAGLASGGDVALANGPDPAAQGSVPTAQGLDRGAYVLADLGDGDPEVLLIGTGSEVQLALGAGEALAAAGTPARVVSMPSWEIFAAQDAGYRDEVLPPGLTARVAVEAARSFGWERWVGDRGAIVGLDRFGASAPGKVLFAELGFTVDRVVEAAREVLARG